MDHISSRTEVVLQRLPSYVPRQVANEDLAAVAAASSGGSATACGALASCVAGGAAVRWRGIGLAILSDEDRTAVSGQWSVVSGQWSVVSGQWSVVSGQWSVSGQSVVMGHGSRVVGHGSCVSHESWPQSRAEQGTARGFECR